MTHLYEEPAGQDAVPVAAVGQVQPVLRAGVLVEPEHLLHKLRLGAPGQRRARVVQEGLDSHQL